MRFTGYLACTLLAVAAFGGGTASAVNICRAGRMTCATTMPIDGYCECTSHGATISGTVVPTTASHQPVNATAGGCGAHPAGPGCK